MAEGLSCQLPEEDLSSQLPEEPAGRGTGENAESADTTDSEGSGQAEEVELYESSEGEGAGEEAAEEQRPPPGEAPGPPPLLALEELCEALAGSVVEGGGEAARALLERGLLWCRALPVPPGMQALEGVEDMEEEDEEEALRAYPSSHSCLACNVVALRSLLKEGAQSRFALRGAVPPVPPPLGSSNTRWSHGDMIDYVHTQGLRGKIAPPRRQS
jgi:hypothetical protein